MSAAAQQGDRRRIYQEDDVHWAVIGVGDREKELTRSKQPLINVTSQLLAGFT